MEPNFIVDYWYIWAAGLILFPTLSILPILKYLRDVIDSPPGERTRAISRVLNPGIVAVVMLFVTASFAAFVLFMAAVILGAVTYIQALLT